MLLRFPNDFKKGLFLGGDMASSPTESPFQSIEW